MDAGGRWIGSLGDASQSTVEPRGAHEQHYNHMRPYSSLRYEPLVPLAVMPRWVRAVNKRPGGKGRIHIDCGTALGGW